MIRFLDISIAIITLLIVMPLVLLLVVLMFFLQGTPIIFSQKRTGKNFKPFKLYKLRTMQLYSEDQEGITLGQNDYRITKLGRWLRNYNIDELPQLINVLKGEMAIVGPRPQLVHYTNKFKDLYGNSLTIKPGLISPATIKYNNEGEILKKQKHPKLYFEQVLLPEKCAMDAQLANNFTLTTYVKVLIAFVKSLF